MDMQLEFVSDCLMDYRLEYRLDLELVNLYGVDFSNFESIVLYILYKIIKKEYKKLFNRTRCDIINNLIKETNLWDFEWVQMLLNTVIHEDIKSNIHNYNNYMPHHRGHIHNMYHMKKHMMFQDMLLEHYPHSHLLMYFYLFFSYN